MRITRTDFHEISEGLAMLQTQTSDHDTSDVVGIEYSTTNTEVPHVKHQRSRAVAAVYPQSQDVYKARTAVLNMKKLIKSTIADQLDPLAVDAALDDCKAYWFVAFTNKNALNPHAQKFLKSLFVAISSTVGANDVRALAVLGQAIEDFGNKIEGCDEKDTMGWKKDLEIVGFDFSEVISR